MSKEIYQLTVQNMFVNPDEEIKNYLFYAHILNQCRVIFDENSDYIGAVSFSNFKYNLHLNPILFSALELKQRCSVLKHEMLHIIDLHLTERKKEHNHFWNLATDCAINQLINLSHLPEGCITPDNLFDDKSIVVPPKMTAEFYYDLILKYKDKLPPNNNGEKRGFDYLGDSDSTAADTIKEITKEIIKSAIDSTKSCGNIPSEIRSILELKYKKEINWRKELQKIIGKLKVDKKKTIMKPNRRNPNRKDLYGNKKDVKNEILVITDESGSVSNKDEAKALSEVVSLCQMFKIDVDLIRVDTEASEVSKLSKNSIEYTRLKSGGTYLSSAIEKINKDYDVIIILTDGELQRKDVKNFEDLNKEIIWLVINTKGDFEFLKSKKMKLIHIQHFKG